MLTASELREILSYDSETGVFRWKVARSNSVTVGDRAGCINQATGYWYIWVGDRLYKASRLAVLYVTGEWPSSLVDHRNGIKDDDRYANLRPANHSQNSANIPRHRDNKSGFKGVHLHKLGKFRAEICSNGVRRHLGLFESAEIAHAAYLAAANEQNGEFARA